MVARRILFIRLFCFGNVVGYQQNEAKAGYKMVTPSFDSIGEATYNIQDLSVEGAEDMAATIQTMNSAGGWTAMYYWYNEYTEGGVTYPAGWFDALGVTEADINLKPGEAVFYYAGTDTTVQSAGEVATEVSLTANNGYTMVGNGTPVSINVSDISLSGASVADMAVTLQTMNAAGQWTAMYYWYNEFTEGGVTYPAGWFDALGVNEADVTLAPGESVFLYAPIDGVVVDIPSAL